MASRDPGRYARPAPPPQEHDSDWARSLGHFVLWALAVIGGLLVIIETERSVVSPLAGGSAAAWITTAAALVAVACVVCAVVLSARYPTGARPPLRSVAVGAAIVAGFFSFSMLSEWQSADRLVADYCAYGAVSNAQLDGCKSHVTANEVRARDTAAAHFAQRDSDECGAGSGPLCDDVVTRRGYEDQLPPPGQ
jgi:hypothetical protein